MRAATAMPSGLLRTLCLFALLTSGMDSIAQEMRPMIKPQLSDGTPSIFPPWQKGENNNALHRGLEFTVPQVDVLSDFYGDLSNPKLILFVGGNYFFAMAPPNSRSNIRNIEAAYTGKRCRPDCWSNRCRQTERSP